MSTVMSDWKCCAADGTAELALILRDAGTGDNDDSILESVRAHQPL